MNLLFNKVIKSVMLLLDRCEVLLDDSCSSLYFFQSELGSFLTRIYKIDVFICDTFFKTSCTAKVFCFLLAEWIYVVIYVIVLNPAVDFYFDGNGSFV